MATPVFCCGFECGVTDGSAHFSRVGSTSYSTSTVRTGLRSLRINPTSGSAYASTGFAIVSSQNVIARAYIRFATLPGSDTRIFYNLSTGVGIHFKSSDSKLYTGQSNGTVFNLGATGVAITTGIWYCLDLQLDCDQNPHLIDGKVDGTALGQYSNSAAAATINDLYFGDQSGTRTYDLYVDDVLLSYTPADYPLGAGKVDHFIPTADGTHNVAGSADFKRGAAGTDILNSTTDAYLLVQKEPLANQQTTPPTNSYISAIAPPNDTDYVEIVIGTGTGVSTPTTAPRAVEVYVQTAQSATQSGSYKLNLVDNGTVGLIKEQVGVGGVTNVLGSRKHFDIAPSGAVWKIGAGNGNFNDLRIRFYSADAAPDQYFVGAMIEAEFAEGGGPPPASYSHRLMLLGVG